MNGEKIENRIEKIKECLVQIPANEIFLDTEKAKNIWPKEILKNN